MTIPLDRLYHFVADQAHCDMLIYRWYPHGHKKPENLKPLINYKQHGDRWGAINPIMICHDQEPLNHKLYDPAALAIWFNERWRPNANPQRHQLVQYLSGWNLRGLVEQFNAHDQVLLLHSEQHSRQVDLYAQWGCVPVYYWAHALIAGDWYRYAQWDKNLEHHTDQGPLFLIYNRSWSGSREYRLTFAAGLIDNQLVEHCRTTFSPWCDHVHYTQHQWHNPALAITRQDLQEHFAANTACADASADYDSRDYQDCGIEVVLETVMDDSRWHLTEKALRPLACGRAFILAAAPGCLQYLRSYGFRTFAPWIDETYDTIADTGARIDAILLEMQRLSGLNESDRTKLLQALDEIARHNRQHFFSSRFHQQVVSELHHNLAQGLDQVSQHRHGRHMTQVKTLIDQIPDRDSAASARRDQLYNRIMNWIQDPASDQGNW